MKDAIKDLMRFQIPFWGASALLVYTLDVNTGGERERERKLELN